MVGGAHHRSFVVRMFKPSGVKEWMNDEDKGSTSILTCWITGEMDFFFKKKKEKLL